jgi:MoaA/NifB/PqqE/SkfB family radical SAM enzyme
MSYTTREIKLRESIEIRKPEAWKKIQQIPQRIKEGKSIALMQLQYSYVCNQKCSHCAIEKFKINLKGKKMNSNDVAIIANQAHNYGLYSICLSGGEPTIFPDLEQVIDAIKPERFVLSMDTNGYKLSEEKIKWLVEKGVDRIHLSIDGLEENHDEFRHKPGAWKHNIEMLPICKENGLGVVINIVATKDLVRSKEIEKQLEFLKQFNFHSSLIYAKPVGTFEQAKDQVLNSVEFEYLETLTKKYNCSTHLTINNGLDIGCLCYKRHFSILPNGESLPCPWIPISMGNVLEEGLETILNRGLSNPWFSWENKFTCHSGNEDSYFYQNIISQIENHKEYPVSYNKIDWHLEYFKK